MKLDAQDAAPTSNSLWNLPGTAPVLPPPEHLAQVIVANSGPGLIIVYLITICGDMPGRLRLVRRGRLALSNSCSIVMVRH